jgi:hypothetical protein
MNLKKIIREEMDDFKWIMDEPINPWVEYNVLIIDTKLTDEEINEYIEMAINTVNIGNKDAWIVGRQEDINRIQFYTDEDAAVIYINPNNNHLQYSDLEWFNDNEAWKTEFKNYKIIKTSELKNNLKESTDDLDWIRDIEPQGHINSVEDINYNLHRPFALFDPETGEMDTSSDIKNNVYWLESLPESPNYYNVCWETNSNYKHCIDYRSTEIVDNFSGYGVWLWKFTDTLIKESTDDLDWIRDEVNADELTTFKIFFVPGQTYYMKRTLNPKNTEPYVFIDITPDRIYGELFNFIGESFSFNYVTKRLEELGLTLLDLLPDNNPQSI